ncbi:hypothetical protein ZIOFF_002173 [Zingiber officinale]|uniref:Acireductone dioxygenase n=2 Tax=Zingiber officinale TaxID=94328 RepID=A0A8J5M9A1_ZINOF|nr:hypothetical protein ZIOFF_002173 [Zingiber officinale]
MSLSAIPVVLICQKKNATSNCIYRAPASDRSFPSTRISASRIVFDNVFPSLQIQAHCLKHRHPVRQRHNSNPMAPEAWLIAESDEDQRLPHHRNPREFVPMSKLQEIGVIYWYLDPKNYESNEELKKIREDRGYSYMDLLELSPGKVENYEEKLKNFYREHIHADEEIRYCLEGSGYFDVRDKDDMWIRIWIKEGDMIVLPAGIYHRFTLDTSNYVKLMRLFIGEPVWTAYNRPQEEHPARQGYVESLMKKGSGVAVAAH